jgi:hypothetical protein
VLRLTDCVGETARNQQLIVVEATSSLRRCLLRLIGVYWAFEQVRTRHDLDADVSRQHQRADRHVSRSCQHTHVPIAVEQIGRFLPERRVGRVGA